MSKQAIRSKRSSQRRFGTPSFDWDRALMQLDAGAVVGSLARGEKPRPLDYVLQVVAEPRREIMTSVESDRRGGTAWMCPIHTQPGTSEKVRRASSCDAGATGWSGAVGKAWLRPRCCYAMLTAGRRSSASGRGRT